MLSFIPVKKKYKESFHPEIAGEMTMELKPFHPEIAGEMAMKLKPFHPEIAGEMTIELKPFHPKITGEMVSQPRINKIKIEISWCPNRIERLNQLESQPS